MDARFWLPPLSMAALLTSCTLSTDQCPDVRRADIPSLRHGGQLRIIQVNRMPTHYWYRAQYSIANNRMYACKHWSVDHVSEEELESVDHALDGRAVDEKLSDGRCATVSIYIQNG